MSEEVIEVLLVEDNENYARLTQEAFEEYGDGMSIRIVASLDRARQTLRHELPDLAVIDLVPQAGRTPGSIEWLGEDHIAGRIPVVILTERGDQQTAVAAIKAGALDFIVKTEATLKDLPHIARRVLAEWQQRHKATEAERTLRQSEARYRHISQQFQTLLDGIPDVLVLLDHDLRIEWINRAGQERFKISEAPLESTCYRLFHNYDRPCDGCPVLGSFDSGCAEDNLVAGADGAIWGVKAYPLVNIEGRVQNVIGLASEVTEKIKLRSESLRAAQLATLGELAAGVAHEINNPANGIINYAQLLLDSASEDSPDREIAADIIDEGTRIARIVKNLLSFAHIRGEEKRPVAIREIIDPCLDLTGSQLKKEGILLELDLADDLPPVLVMSQTIQQVVLNLINNARYALNEKYPPKHPGKRLRISGRLQASGGQQTVRLEFEDQGIGIPDSVLKRVMDPFFTTKPADRGTGLGLSMSREIILKQGGQIQIASREGVSTTVTIELPASPKEARS